MATLNNAIITAANKYAIIEPSGGEKEKYIAKTIRMISKLNEENQMIIAALHNVIALGAYSINDIIDDGYEQEIVDAVDVLTQKPWQTDEEWLELVCNNRLATMVQLVISKEYIVGRGLSSLDRDINRTKHIEIARRLLKEKV